MRAVFANVLVGLAASVPLNGWVQSGEPVAASTPVKMRLALLREEPSALEVSLLAISDPRSPRFRNYLSDAQVAELVRPKTGAMEAAEKWARAMLGEGVELERSQHGDYLFVSSTVASVSSAFEGIVDDVAVFHHEESSKSSVRAVAPSATPSSLVPASLREHVWAVLDLVELLPVPPQKQVTSGKQPGDTIEPPILHKQYGLVDDPEAVGGRTSTSQGVAMFEQAQFAQSDVDVFQETYDIPKVEFQILGPNDGGYFGEAGLDTQWITATGRGVPSWWLSQNEFDMLAWCELVLNMTQPPSVVSISWGSPETSYHAEHMQAGSDCFQKMGVQGITVFTASGDGGTGKQGTFSCKAFDPNWPGTCPYITTVGGTYLESGTENGWSGSGGGFSAVFPRPAWQDKAVAAYMQSATLPSSDLYTADGCAKPDIAAVATNYKVASAGGFHGTLTGTSASSPAFAGMVAVINDLLVDSGKPTVGFINPALYAAAEAGSADFLGFDVVTGNNKHSGCDAGFSAVEGWDAVTGLGTPLFQNLKSLLMTDFKAVTV